MSIRGWPVALALTVVVGAACLGDDDQTTGSVTRDVVQNARAALDPALLAQLDSGNAAMRAGDRSTALERYRRAVELDGSVAAAWFGVYMAADALGLDDEAAEALGRARALEPRASLLDPDSPPEP